MEVVIASQKTISIAVLSFIVLCVIGCALLTGVEGLAKTALFFSITVIPMVGGSFLIYKYFWSKTKLARLLVSVLFGLIFFGVSFLTMYIDTLPSQSNTFYILNVSLIVGVIAFFFSTFVSLFYPSIFRRTGGKEGE